MASTGKRKTTMAKLAREGRLRERRIEKKARKDARRQTSAEHPDGQFDAPDSQDPEDAGTDPTLETPPAEEPGLANG